MKKDCLHCKDKNRMSELFRIGSQLKKSTQKVIKHAVLHGEIVAEQGIVLKRLQECYKCEYRMMKDRCKLCGCFLKVKTALKAEECPDGRW